MPNIENRHNEFLSECLSIDLEVDPKTAKVFAFAAVRNNDQLCLKSRRNLLEEDLDRLEDAIVGISHPIGHNFLCHDMEHLIAARSRLTQIMQGPIDTLWLNPLAFPRNPYHRLNKYYQDGRLAVGHVNNPELDARLVFEVLANQLDAFQKLGDHAPDALVAYHYLTTRMEMGNGFDAVFRYLRKANCPTWNEAIDAIHRMLSTQTCKNQVEQVIDHLSNPQNGWPTAYALSWITEAGRDSVMPPWVRAQFREASLIVRNLRDTSCKDSTCDWCIEQNDPVHALKRWFGFENFRTKPVDQDGQSLQKRIVDEIMNGTSVLGIMPTGTGKSVCYQVPALSKFDKIGALTVVISPLVALMADQVQGMKRAGISCAVTVNGQMSIPERQDALDKVRMGVAGILIIAPEQLRSISIQSVLKQREVGLWAIDEAHCVSKWGHDFRPDYRYLGQFIKNFSGDHSVAPILCLTATAKPEVVTDIVEYFKSRVGVDLLHFDGGASRENLSYIVRPTTKRSKKTDILNVIEEFVSSEGRSGAVVYCATRKNTKKVAEFLKSQGMNAAYFHAGLEYDVRQDIQKRFREGSLRVIVATNAFGMGIDKPDIRLVVHADVPQSLESYLQETGRAGRDGKDASCVLLFAEEDVERQFQLLANSRLAQHEIGAILRALRRIDEHTNKTGKIVATPGEIVRFEKDQEFERNIITDNTRVKTAVAWLEEAKLVAREENHVQILPSSLMVDTIDEAEQRLVNADITQMHRKQLLDIVQYLISAPADRSVSTDQLCNVSGLTSGKLIKAMVNLEYFGVVRNEIEITIFIHVGIKQSSFSRLKQLSNLERDIIVLLRELVPDADKGTSLSLRLSKICQNLRDRNHKGIRPDMIEKLISRIELDGRKKNGNEGNIRLRKVNRNTLNISFDKTWDIILKTVEIRWEAAGILLKFLAERLDKHVRGKNQMVETTIGDLLAQLKNDVSLKSDGLDDITGLLEQSLLWMHEQDVLTLGKGLNVFCPAITVFLKSKGGKFTQSDFLPLQKHYDEQTFQVHVMEKYAKIGIDKIENAERLVKDYFVSDKNQFMKRWMPGMAEEIKRQTTRKSWTAIVDDLGNKVQQDIVVDDREQTNVLVLAGPGSGKTRVLVHRIAYLLRIKREDPRGILVLVYNRHAAVEIRIRLRMLVGDDAARVMILTCHSFAMKLVGASFSGIQVENKDFKKVIVEAVHQFNSEGLSKSEAESKRESLVQGYRWILVDEYQDIGLEEYNLISAVAGRSLKDSDLKLSLFAVGDDDQNVYSFKGASVEFIRKFKEDYNAKLAFLVENYRSTSHIINAANQVISGSSVRMKTDHDIKINQARVSQSCGGYLQNVDSVSHGRVQLLDVNSKVMHQAITAIDELFRLSRLDLEWDWSRVAVISRNWEELDAVRTYAESQGLNVDMANIEIPKVWRLRETLSFESELRKNQNRLLCIEDIRLILSKQTRNKWVDLLAEGLDELECELGTGMMSVPDIIDWLAEWSRQTRSKQRGLLLLVAHRSKGLEFDHVVILNGKWTEYSKEDDPDAPRRLFYVAMTRAVKSLTILMSGKHSFLTMESDSILIRSVFPDSQKTSLSVVKYQSPAIDSVDLSFAGRQSSRHKVHQAISSAKIGDSLSIDFQDSRYVLLNKNNDIIGRMKIDWQPPQGHVLISGQIGAIINWRKSDNKENHIHNCKRDSWETILPELIFQPKNAVTLSTPEILLPSKIKQTKHIKCISEKQTAETFTEVTSDNTVLKLDENTGLPKYDEVYENAIKSLEWLMADDMDINAWSNKGYTLMHQAARKNAVIVMMWLKLQGGDINVRNDDGETPMHKAAENNAVLSMEWLKNQGANIKARNSSRQTPMDVAISANSIDVINWLKVQQAQTLNADVSKLSYSKPVACPGWSKNIVSRDENRVLAKADTVLVGDTVFNGIAEVEIITLGCTWTVKNQDAANGLKLRFPTVHFEIKPGILVQYAYFNSSKPE